MADRPKAFVEPVFRGSRFENVEVPLDVLPDLVAYKDLILSVAKELYRSRTGRQRVPKGFDSSFQLTLAGEIRQGSAGLSIVRRAEDPAVVLRLAQEAQGDPFEAARDLVEDYVDAVSTERKPPSEFPENLVQLFGNFGRHLRESEEVVFHTARHPTPVKYTQDVRKRILLQTATTYEREVELVGRIVELDKERNQFRLRTDDFGPLDVGFKPLQSVMLTTALRDERFTKVAVAALAEFDRSESIRGVKEVLSVSLLDVVEERQMDRIEDRLSEFKRLEPGWSNEGPGDVPSQDSVEWVRQVLLGLMAKDQFPPPHLYPTESGQIRAEWTFGPWEVSAVFRYTFPTPSVAMEAIDTEGGDFHEAIIPLHGAVDEDLAIAEFVKSIQSEASDA